MPAARRGVARRRASDSFSHDRGELRKIQRLCSDEQHERSEYMRPVARFKSGDSLISRVFHALSLRLGESSGFGPVYMLDRHAGVTPRYRHSQGSRRVAYMPPMRPTITASLLSSLDVIAHETTSMLNALDRQRETIPEEDRREAKRRVLELRAKAQELFDWIGEAWGLPRN